MEGAYDPWTHNYGKYHRAGYAYEHGPRLHASTYEGVYRHPRSPFFDGYAHSRGRAYVEGYNRHSAPHMTIPYNQQRPSMHVIKTTSGIRNQSEIARLKAQLAAAERAQRREKSRSEISRNARHSCSYTHGETQEDRQCNQGENHKYGRGN